MEESNTTTDIDDIIRLVKTYNPTADDKFIRGAYEFAALAHNGQNRLSGEPYITHPLAIAKILAELKMDTNTIVAGILHDVIEDTHYTYEDIEERFGKEVAQLVDGVTKIAKFQFYSKEQEQVESFRKMFVAMANDIRIIIIKLCDRLHNMRTLSSMREDKQVQKANETLNIYAPIANRLGISMIKWEFEDLAFRYLEPDEYHDLVNNVVLKRKEREEYIDNVIGILKAKMDEEGIDCDISGRPKHFYSIYKKMQSGRNFSEIYDLIAVRIIVNTVNDCYAALGWVHTLWKPIPGRIKDYIAMPKPNMYQSLHTTVLGPGGSPFEIQIRTNEMHLIAEYGIAAHWKYKEGKKGSDELAEKLHWLMELKELEEESEGSDDFVETVKTDLYNDEIFVFTPKGRVIELPLGSTPIDFAYRIHTDIGNKCSGARVNGKIVPLTYGLSTGEIVQIITSPISKGPSRDWLGVVKSPQAKSKIRAYFRKTDKDENIIKGKESFKRELKHYTLEYNDIVKNEYTDFTFKRFNVTSWEDLFAVIGYGGLRAGYVIQRIKDNYKKDFAEPETINLVKPPKSDKGRSVHIQGHSDLAVKFARCCMPVPGDHIIGYITRGRGITVHRADCINIQNSNERDRLIDVNWIEHTSKDDRFTTELVLRSLDRKGLLADVSTAIGNEGINISGLNTKPDSDGIFTMHIDIVVDNAEQIETLIRKLSNIPDVLKVFRL